MVRIFVALLSFFGLFLFTSASTVFAQQVVTPTIYCLGSCPTVGPTDAQGTPGVTGGADVTVEPTNTDMSPAVTETSTTAPEVSPTAEPCLDETTSVQHWGKHHKKHHGHIGNFMQQLLEMIKQLLELIGKYLGGNGGDNPGGVPEPTTVPGEPTPCEPTQTVEEPTDVPEPTQAEEEPTEGAEPTSATGTTPPASGTGTTANVTITFYGSWDNDPPSSTDIAYPVIHDKAGGTGTYEDPLTFASPAGDGAYEIGTKIYVPFVQKYFIKEDQCAVSWTAPEGCGAVTMVDLYVGNPSDAEAVVECENSLTPGGDTEIMINPPAGLTVSAEPIWDQSTGTCMTLP
jgi:hypothetical protein